MGSERNFRSHYYEKMGFRGVEEKKSLDILLREKPIDLARIQNFCLRFPLPSIYRVQVWQLLLRVLPIHTSNTDFVWTQRVEQFREVERALMLTRKISSHMDPCLRITVIWLLERNSIKHDLSAQLREYQCQNFISIVRSLQQLVNSSEEVYWIGKGIYSFLETSVMTESRALFDCLAKLLEEEQSLLTHLETCGGIRCSQYQQWWDTGFAGMFQPSILARLWDKLIGGSSKVLAYILACALFRCKGEVMTAKTQDEIVAILSNMKEERQDACMTQALDLWEMDGCPLTPCVCHETMSVVSDSEGAVSTGNKNSLENRLSMEINVGQLS